MAKFTFLFLFLILNASGYSQSKWDLVVSGGLSTNINRFSEASGVNLGIGLQKSIWRDRIRIHPSVNYGRFFRAFILHTKRTGFNSTSLRYDVEGDLIRVGSIGFLIGTGLMLNRTSGWIEADGSKTFSKSRFSTSTMAYNFLAGFRHTPKKRGKAITELILLNVTFDKWDQDTFSEVTFLQVREIILINTGKKN